MKKILLLTFLFFFGIAQAQIFDPVDWSTTIEKVADKENEYLLITTATIETGWHLYSQEVPDGGPVATEFSYEENENYSLKGNTQEDEGHTGHDNTFDMEIKYFSDVAIFKQRVIHNDPNIAIKATVYFMVCDDEKCLPPAEVDLSFTKGTTKKEEKTSTTDIPKTADIEDDSKRGLFTIFFLSFLAGFAALLTPCVFPMIPMTVSFFTKQSKTKAAGIKNAIIYGVCIIAIYVVLGLAVTGIFGASVLNELATNVWFNVIFFAILVIFAISFMGAFEIMLPNSWANKVDRKADKGGLIGIFFMALALAIVSFSCTGPIVGSLLVEAASKGGIAPVVGMLGFSLALALPFALFAAFPGWLNSLPKSGGWLNTVKVVLGFLELALAFKFLSQADLVLQAHWLEREVFLAIWIAIFGTLSLYLFGKIQLPHDSQIKNISVGRLMLGLLTLTFTIYMIPGLWGAPLKIISGFPPPMHYSESPNGIGSGSTISLGELPEGAKYGPHNITSFLDYDKGLAYAKKVNKPVLIDFTGHACVNCRKMEEHVWSDPSVLKILKEEIVLISLYVDDKRSLPNGEQITSKISGKKLKTIGQKWSEFQILRYKANAQPLYVLMDHNENNLIKPSAYNPDIADYKKWLKDGITKFNN